MSQSAPNYVFDTSALIEIERSEQGNKGLRKMPEPPGKWLIVPSKVGKQLDGKDAPPTTKKWIESGRQTKLLGEIENTTFMTLRVREPLLEDPDIQGIVVAANRHATYVVENGRAKTVAESMDIRCINSAKFLKEIQPSLL
jgi:hypothetical protein